MDMGDCCFFNCTRIQIWYSKERYVNRHLTVTQKYMVHHNESLGYRHKLQQPDLLFRFLIPPDLGISFGAFQFSPGISQLFLLGINLDKAKNPTKGRSGKEWKLTHWRGLMVVVVLILPVSWVPNKHPSGVFIKNEKAALQVLYGEDRPTQHSNTSEEVPQDNGSISPCTRVSLSWANRIPQICASCLANPGALLWHGLGPCGLGTGVWMWLNFQILAPLPGTLCPQE